MNSRSTTSASMNRRSTTSRENNKKGLVYEWRKKTHMYAVFEATSKREDKDEYLVYKLDSVNGVGARKGGDVKILGQPILTLEFGMYPMSMSIFSVGSKLYFVGGFHLDDWRYVDSPNAYMFDLSLNQPKLVSIQSMNLPKPFPLVFGPVNTYQFYLFSGSQPKPRYTYPSFEILDTRTDKWEPLAVPSFLTGLSFNSSSTLCGSNILLSPCNLTEFYVFCTRSEIWRVVKKDLPFDKALYLFHVNNIGHILLGLPGPELFSSDVDMVGPFKALGMMDILTPNPKADPKFLGGWGDGRLAGFYYFDCCNSICVVRATEPGRCVPPAVPGLVNFEHFIIDIYDVNFSGLDGTDVKAKVKNTLQYKYVSKIRMEPRHFLVVG